MDLFFASVLRYPCGVMRGGVHLLWEVSLCDGDWVSGGITSTDAFVLL